MVISYKLAMGGMMSAVLDILLYITVMITVLKKEPNIFYNLKFTLNFLC